METAVCFITTAATGELLKTINVGYNSYGALVDGQGTLWLSSRGHAGLTRIDNPNAGTSYNSAIEHSISFIRTDGDVYGMGIDKDGYIYSAGYYSNRLRKYDPFAGKWVYQLSAQGYGRGIATDGSGNVWVADSPNRRVNRFDAATGELIARIGVGTDPTGVAVDSEGKIWVTNNGSHTVQRIDPTTNAVDFTQSGHQSPYNYSDMTGFISRNITSRNGSWSTTYDSGEVTTPWGNISWSSSEPENTKIIVQARTSADSTAWSPWQTVSSGTDADLPTGRYLGIMVTLTVMDGETSPILYDLTVCPSAVQEENSSPVFTSVPIVEAAEGDSYLYAAEAKDADGDSFTYSLDLSPKGLIVDGVTGIISWTPTHDQAGDSAVTVRITDSRGAFGLQHYTLSVDDRLVAVPNLIGQPQVTTEQILADVFLTVGELSQSYSDTVPETRVVSQNPLEGTVVPINSPVNIEISLGPPVYPVPDVVGMAQAEAETTLAEALMTTGEISQEYNFTVPIGQIITQSPAAGEQVYADTPVNLTVSLGVKMVIVPDVVGMELDAARTALSGAELTPGAVTEQYSKTVPVGKVISQSIGGDESVPALSDVDLTLSLGVRMITVPDFTGTPLNEAKEAIENNYLVVGRVIEEYLAEQPAGEVFRQSISPGETVESETPIDMYVSLGSWSGPDDTPPQVIVYTDLQQAPIGSDITVHVWAGDNVGVVTRDLKINGQVTELNGDQVVYANPPAGVYTAEFTATDGAGLISTATVVFRIYDPNDTTPPSVSLEATQCEDITDLFPIIGTISDESPLVYTLYHRQQGTTSWTAFAEGEGPLTGELGVLDPSLMKNGVYELALHAEDLNGNGNTAIGCVLVDGNLKLGHLSLPVSDREIPATGPSLSLERVYDSRTGTGDFGPGWNLASSEVTVQPTKSLGQGWDEYPGSGMFTTYYLMEQHRHVLAVRLPGDELLSFKMNVTPKSSLLYPLRNRMPLTAGWLADPDSGAIVEALDATSSVMLVGNELREWGTDPYNPTRFRITRKDGTQLIVSTTSGLESITDVYGNTVSYSDSGITHSSGAAITFERGADNRIETITDPLGKTIEYHYNEEGTLEKVIQRGDEPGALRLAAAYGYTDGIIEQPVLKEIKAPDGTVLGSFEFTGDRMTALIDADGNKLIYGYDLPNHRQEITDRLGNTSVYEYDSEGNVTQKTDAQGNTISWAYDENNNKLNETDPLGNTTAFTYDADNNLLTETDPLGNTTCSTYNDRNLPLTITDAEGNVTTNTYNDKGKILSTVDPLGNSTSFGYNFLAGDLTSSTDSLGHTTLYTYDGQSNRLSETDALGNTTSYTHDGYGNELTRTVTRMTDSGPVSMTTTMTYDIRSRLISTTDPDGNITRTEYDPVHTDKKSAEIDANGQRTEYEYDVNDNLVATRFPDGTSQSTSYDAEGNRLSSTDREGNTTTFVYDALNRLVRTVFANGRESENIYDAAGRLLRSIDQQSHATEYEYDAAGRRTATINALGHRTEYQYDDAGNQVAVIDARGNTTSFEYDAANRRTATVFADTSRTETTYDAAGRKVLATDQNSISTSFAYDALGRLTAVVDTLGNRTAYSYDELGNKLSQTDAEGRTTSWTYDNNGNALTHTLPMGQTESFTYDAVGKQISRTDFNGATTTFEYSPCCGRLTRKVFPDNTTEEYSYLGTGQVASVTDATGTTSYSYDSAGRLLRRDNPDGIFIQYTYDLAGNRTALTVPSGTTTFTFDALNRLASTTDPDSNTTSYSYDANGNRASVTLPDGTVTNYTYDALNRLTLLENLAADTSLLSSYSYTLGLAGNRLQVVENHSGRTVDYSYDNLYRLTDEEISDPVQGNSVISYTYDKVGNRKTKTVDGVTATYIYNNNDRLEDDGSATYLYDDNGNLTKKSATEGVTDYIYDDSDRLIQINQPAADTIYYWYDHNGIRVAKQINTTLYRYIVDSNRPYAQVLEEYEDDGATVTLAATYVYGDDLISQNRGGISYYLYDGQLSSRQLIDGTGAVTDSYDYDAFGNLLNSTGSTVNNYRYTGEQFDPNAGFYYLRARYYDQGTGRFTSVDPYAGNMHEPVTLHRYLYAFNNPALFVDPSGKTPYSKAFFGNYRYFIGYKTNFWQFGRFVHGEIFTHIWKNHGESTAIPEFPIPGGGPNGGTGRVDVYVEPYIYEIKPLGGVVDPVQQLNRYINASKLPSNRVNMQVFRLGMKKYSGKISDPSPYVGLEIDYEWTGPGILEYTFDVSSTGKGILATGAIYTGYRIAEVQRRIALAIIMRF